MKREVWLAALLALVMLLTSCGQGTADGVQKDAPAPQAVSLDMDDIENNGGHFVRVGGRVYFRKYGSEAVEKTALFGSFFDAWSATGQESEIVYYDLTTRDVETAFTDTGTGGIYCADGGFYLQERINGEDYVMWYAPDGSETRIVRQGTLLGVTDSGLLAVEDSDVNESSFYLYRNGESAGYFISAYPMTFVGLSEDGLFLLRVEHQNEDDFGSPVLRTLWQLPVDSEGQLIQLGTLSETEAAYSAEPEQFLVTEKNVGIVIGYYAGTGHFLNDYAAVTAVPGQEDSLTELDAAVSETSEEFDPVKLAVDDAGDIVVKPYLTGELRIGWDDDEGYTGDLELYNGSEWVTLKENLCPARPDGTGYATFAQHMEYVDGAAYVSISRAHASPLDSIGWRDAYKLLSTEYLVVPASEGQERELARVDCDCTLQGNVWFIEDSDLSALLWQQNTFEETAWNSEAESAMLIPIAPDAVWNNKEEIVSADVVVVPGEADYYGYPVPEEEGVFLCLDLNREGQVTYLTPTSPDALLSIDIGVDEAELSGALEMANLSPRPSDEDTPWYWARLTALQDGVTVRVERTPDDPEPFHEDGAFLPGSSVIDRTLNRGEFVGVRVSLPWHPELRVCALRDGTYGAYVFGEDNYLYEEPVGGRYAQKILAGYPLADIAPPAGHWFWRDANGAYVNALRFDADDKTLFLETEEDVYRFTWDLDWIFMNSWETADMVSITADVPETIMALNGMSGEVGSYHMERFCLDGETVLHLTQFNNGDSALDMLLSDGGAWTTELVLHSYEGAAETAAPPRNVTLTMEAVKADTERDVIWLQTAERTYEEGDEDAALDSPMMYRADPYASCVGCPVTSPTLFDAFKDCADPAYPMRICRATFDRDGVVTALELV